MVIQAGDPRDLLPIEMFRQDIFGVLGGIDTSQDARLEAALRRAVGTVEDDLGAKVLDDTNEYRITLRGEDETVSIAERWHRSVDSVRYREPDEDRSQPPSQSLTVASIPQYYGEERLTLWAPGSRENAPGRWPEGVRTLYVTTSSGLDLTDSDLGDVRRWLILLVRFDLNMQMEEKPTNAIKAVRKKLMRAGWRPKVSGGEPLRDDDFSGGLMGWTHP